jgi:protein-glutamine gamma-glutamyltransferase
MTGRPLLGLVLALIAEGSHWTRVRWEFDDAACGRIWQFTTLGITLAAVLIWLEGNRYTALPSLLSWLPPLLFPLQFVQSYGLRDSLPLSTFSFLSRRRRERNLRFGLIEETPHFNFGNVMFTVAMVAATVGSKSYSWLYLPGIVILTGWMLVSAGRGSLRVMIPLLLVAGVLAMSGRFALEKAEDWLGRGGGGRGGFDPNFVSTLIGTAGTVRQSPDIVWRVHPAPGSAPPRLLRTATFHTFLGSNWQNQRMNPTDFRDLDTRLIGEDAYYLLHEQWNEHDPSVLPAFTLRGAATEESPLPLPGDVAALRGFALDGVERNSFGLVRVFPKHPVIDGSVFWHGGNNPESPPMAKEDLRLPYTEREVIRATLDSLGIHPQMPLAQQLALIRSFFHREFRYTRELTIGHSFYRPDGGTAIDRFLTRSRAGHCEYFATAAALMLREAGIPARYATGYMLVERDTKRGGFVVRGTHGHAWCRVWDQETGLWFDFDPTPPDWLSELAEGPALVQRFNDQFKRLREDFFLWRNHPDNRLAQSWVMLGTGLALGAFIGWRLWHSRRRLEAVVRANGYEGPVVRTPLHQLEKRARKHLGERPPGLPFARWIANLQPGPAYARTLEEAITLHQRLRFDPTPPETADHERLARLARELEAMLGKRNASKGPNG